MDSLPNLGYTSPKRWYDDAFLQESVSSGSGDRQPRPSHTHSGGGSTSNHHHDSHVIDNAHSASGAIHAHGTSDGGSVDLSSQLKSEPPLKMSKIDNYNADADVATSIRMPTCLNDQAQPCSSSQGISHSEMTTTSANERTQASNEDVSKTDSLPNSTTNEGELSKQDETPTDSTSDKDGKTLEKSRQDKVEDEQTKMKLVCRVTLSRWKSSHQSCLYLAPTSNSTVCCTRLSSRLRISDSARMFCKIVLPHRPLS